MIINKKKKDEKIVFIIQMDIEKIKYFLNSLKYIDNGEGKNQAIIDVSASIDLYENNFLATIEDIKRQRFIKNNSLKYKNDYNEIMNMFLFKI
jgi:hypothetical protein